MLKDLFRRQQKYVTINAGEQAADAGTVSKGAMFRGESPRRETPDGVWIKCPKCGEVLFNQDLKDNAHVCPCCLYHFRISARDRLELLVDPDSFTEWGYESLKTADPLGFPGYREKLEEAQNKSRLPEGVLAGQGKIAGLPVVLAFNEGNFMMGSMGSVVGEILTRTIEKALQLQLPLIIFSISGGARMQEGIFSLYQMAKTSAALGRFSEAGLLYISVLTDPTFGGVTASYASLGDINIAEPGALIGFTGPRVIKQTMGQELPAGAQTAEYNQDHGLIDLIVERKQMRTVLARLLRYHRKEVANDSIV